jgi:hypothetical protein
VYALSCSPGRGAAAQEAGREAEQARAAVLDNLSEAIREEAGLAVEDSPP